MKREKIWDSEKSENFGTFKTKLSDSDYDSYNDMVWSRKEAPTRPDFMINF